MNPKTSTTAGLVLAAGASTRMGEPKALLRFGAKPLAVHQADLLAEAGCDPVVIVLGADGDRIGGKLNDARVVQHPAWRTGRLSSVAAGLRSVGSRAGYVVLPVDTVGVRVTTVAALIHGGRAPGVKALRPVYRERPGQVVWISHLVASELLLQVPDPALRLDVLLKRHTGLLEVEDDAILNNVNTPEDWRHVTGELV